MVGCLHIFYTNMESAATSAAVQGIWKRWKKKSRMTLEVTSGPVTQN